MVEETRFLFLSGPIGHGKTTLSLLLKAQLERFLDLPINLVLAGSLIAKEVKSCTELGKLAAPYFQSGKKRIPQEIVYEILKPHMRQGEVNLIEGVPRNYPQLVGPELRDPSSPVILLERLPLTTVLGRTAGRKICAVCGFIFGPSGCVRCRDRTPGEYRQTDRTSVVVRYRSELHDFNTMEKTFRTGGTRVFRVSNCGSVGAVLAAVTARLLRGYRLSTRTRSLSSLLPGLK